MSEPNKTDTEPTPIEWNRWIMQVHTWCACPCGIVLVNVAEVSRHWNAGHFHVEPPEEKQAPSESTH